MPYSSTLQLNQQPDGRLQVTERHVDDFGRVHLRHYLAEAGENLQAALAATTVRLDALLATEEFAENLRLIEQRRYGAITTRYITLSQLRQRLRAYYQQATPIEVVALAAFFLTLTDAQLQALFGITAGQLPALKARLQARADTLTALDSATGE